MAQVLFIWLLKFKPYIGNTARDIRAALEVCVVLWWLFLLMGTSGCPGKMWVPCSQMHLRPR